MERCRKIKVHHTDQHPCDTASGAFETGYEMKQAGNADSGFIKENRISAAAQQYGCADKTYYFDAILHQFNATLFSSY
jgi:hypothetical protein